MLVEEEKEEVEVDERGDPEPGSELLELELLLELLDPDLRGSTASTGA